MLSHVNEKQLLISCLLVYHLVNRGVIPHAHNLLSQGPGRKREDPGNDVDMHRVLHPRNDDVTLATVNLE